MLKEKKEKKEKTKFFHIIHNFIYKNKFSVSFYVGIIRYLGNGTFLFFKKKKKKIVKFNYFTIKRTQFFLSFYVIVQCFIGLVIFSTISIYNSILKNPDNKLSHHSTNNISISNLPYAIGAIDIETKDKEIKNEIDREEHLKDLLLGVTHHAKLSSTKKEEKNSENNDIIEKIKYKVKDNDTLSEIAVKFNVNMGSIAGSSNMKELNYIREGQILYIPSQKGFFYRIKKGDNLYNILKKYKVNFYNFMELNPDINFNIFAVGEEIFLPDAEPKGLVFSNWIYPVSSRVLTSGFGWRSRPYRGFHKGVDIRIKYGKVVTVKQGRVTFAGWFGGYGKSIIIKHPGGYKTLYAHLSKIYVRPGAGVRQGQQIGVSGNTGRSTGPHLHFEIVKKGRHINPRLYLKQLRYLRIYKS